MVSHRTSPQTIWRTKWGQEVSSFERREANEAMRTSCAQVKTHRHDAVSDGDAEQRCEETHTQQLGTIAADGSGALRQAPVVHTRRLHLQGPAQPAEDIGPRNFAQLASLDYICLDDITCEPGTHEQEVVPSTRTPVAKLVLNRVRE